MQLSTKTTISELITAYPFLIEKLAQRNKIFKKLQNPILRETLGRVATIEKAAGIGGEEKIQLLLFIAQRIMEQTGESVEIFPPDSNTDKEYQQYHSQPGKEQRLEALKEILHELHEGKDLQSLQVKFQHTVGDISPEEIAQLEQTLVSEGVAESEIKKLCNLHVELFKESLDSQNVLEKSPGHPIHTYMAENRQASELATLLQEQIERLGPEPGQNMWAFSINHLRGLLNELHQITTHYVRKENQLFPLLESHGIEAPTKVMWEVHDDIRSLFKRCDLHISKGERQDAIKALHDLVEAVLDMIYKEEHILFPMAEDTLSQEDWQKARSGDDDIGYAFDILPGNEWNPTFSNQNGKSQDENIIHLDTGALSNEIVNSILCQLPVDLSFVDAEGKVAYYSDSRERVFPRSPAVIGRDVRNCHPPKSVHMVEEILEAFQSGTQDDAEFWLELGGRFIHIQYKALRDSSGKYLGCLEVGHDATHVRALKGQRRLLEWDDK